MVERYAMEPEQSLGSVVACPAAMKVHKDESFTVLNKQIPCCRASVQ